MYKATTGLTSAGLVCQKVLIVDDDPLNTDILEEMFEEMFDIAIADSGTSGLALAAEFKPDLILLDVMMPDMNGYEICQKLKDEPATADIPVLFLTAKGDKEDKIKGLESGASDYITKPFDVEEVVARVNTHMNLRQAQLTVSYYNKELQDQLKERTQDLIRTERRAAFSLLIQGIVHNLRNSLTSIQGGADLINMAGSDCLRRMVEDENVKEEYRSDITELVDYANIITESCGALGNMVDSMMSKSRSDKNERLEVVDLNKVLRQELEFLSTDLKFKSAIRKKVNLSEKMLLLSAVPSEVAQVFRNLVNNSLDAMWQADNGTVFVESGDVPDKVWFSVSDTGPGIPEEIVSRIFDPFFTTKPALNEHDTETPSGTGLGLHSCMDIIKSYNGVIRYEGKVGEGARFVVILPKNPSQ